MIAALYGITDVAEYAAVEIPWFFNKIAVLVGMCAHDWAIGSILHGTGIEFGVGGRVAGCEIVAAKVVAPESVADISGC